jgi:myosin heavy chain 9/10/11/14
VTQLESQLETQETERSKSQRSVRNVDRIVKDLQSQIDRKDKQATQLGDDANRMRDKVEKLLKTIDELQASESTNQLSARRAERELREEKERAARLERELDGWKTLRMEKGSMSGSNMGSVRLGTPGPDGVKRLGTWRSSVVGPADDASSVSGTGVEVPKRKSSIGRTPSLTKGFL